MHDYATVRFWRAGSTTEAVQLALVDVSIDRFCKRNINLEVVINMKIKLKFERGCKSENSTVSHCKTVPHFIKTKVKQSESDLVWHVSLCCSALWVLNRWSSVYFFEE